MLKIRYQLSVVDSKVYRTSDCLVISRTNGLILHTGTNCNTNSEYIWFVCRLGLRGPFVKDNHIEISCDNLKCPYVFLFQIYFDKIVEIGENCIQTPYGTPFKDS